MPTAKTAHIPDHLDGRIHLIRGQKVILDLDLAELYGVKTMVLNQAVKRNRERFPVRFMFRLTARDKREVITNCDYLSRLKFSPVTPLAFTEHGALMAATVLNSRRAIHMSIHLIDAFVRLRMFVADRKELAAKLAALEMKVAGHDGDIQEVFRLLERLLSPPAELTEPHREIGFHTHLSKRSLAAGRRRNAPDN